MLSSVFYPMMIIFDYLSQLDSALLWGLLIVSLGSNFYLFKKNTNLKSQLKRQQKKTEQKTSDHPVSDPHETLLNDIFYDEKFKKSNSSAAPEAAIIQPELKAIKSPILSELETELNDSLWIGDEVLSIKNSENIEAEPVATNGGLRYSILQSLSGWHKSLVPFLLQNAGWFIGVLCFISGSIFFISYTEGFNKSLTIFYTVLSYTLLLAWGGYRLKDKVSHASMSGYILMATSFLLIPLNFSAAAQLLSSSAQIDQYLISIPSILLAIGTLYYTSRLISGLFNRHLLIYFSPVFFAISSLQLLVPWIENNTGLIFLMAVQVSIVTLLLVALIKYMPALLKQVFVDRQYLLVMSVGSLIYAALVSTVHITLSSPLSIALSYYAPIVLLISGALFYIDGQLNDYKEQMNLLSYFSFVAYAVSFLALGLSLDNDPIRNVTLFLAVLLYARLIWLYRSLVPLYLVVALLCLLHFDVFLFDWLLMIPGITPATAGQWYYLASMPLLGVLFGALFFLRKSELQRSKYFEITRHLFHLIIVASITLSTFSQWSIATSHFDKGSGLSMNVVVNIINTMAILLSGYYLLKSKQMNTYELIGNYAYTAYLYVLLLLPVIQIILGFQEALSIDVKLLLLVIIIYYYSLASHFEFINFYSEKSGVFSELNFRLMNKELLVNVSLLISLFILLLVASGFSLSIKTGLMIFIISINFLFLSLTLLNRALFYVFMLVVSASILTIKLYLSHSSSTGLMVISAAFVIFYFIHWLDHKRQDEIELLKLETKKQNNPDKILWFYPGNDFSIMPYCSQDSAQCDMDKTEAIKNV